MKATVTVALAALVACSSPPPEDVTTALATNANPLTAADPLWSPQPHRERPRALCTSKDGTKAWVMLGGTEDDPGQDVAVVDLMQGKVAKRVRLGRSPHGCALDPSGRFLVVTLRYSDRAVILDAGADVEVARVPVPFYTETALWTEGRVFLANRWKDSVLFWDVDLGDGFRVVRTSYDGVAIEDPMGTPVGDNPGPMALSSDGTRLFVGTVAGCTIAVLDAKTGAAIDIDGDPTTTSVGAPKGISRLDFRSPVGGLAVSGRYLFIADTGRGLGQQPTAGNDLDDDGHPGDGTGNVIFQDLQNEIGVLDTTTLAEVHRYTSDTISNQDFRDVDPALPERGLLLPAPDTWKPEVAAFLPPKETWIVAGALPEAMAVAGSDLWVAFAGSNQVQRFSIGADGALTSAAVHATGYNPKAIAAAGGRVVTADRLAESLSVIDPATGDRQSIVVGDVSGGAFPATDAEIGEGINEMTAAFTIDGDQTCVHCHRDNGAIARPIIMPLQKQRLWGARNIMAQRGLYDTRPWFFESAMSEDNFFPVLNEFARKENFCCEEVDPTVWSKYPKLADCTADPALAGCNHVLHCSDDPPPECSARPYAKTVPLLRSAFIKASAKRLFGRDTAFGDVLYTESADGTRKPVVLDFDGITKAVGLFMLRTVRLLPNPNAWLHLPSARRGERLFREPAVGCVLCHPLPLTTTATLPEPFSPFGTPIRFPPVISPTRAPDGTDASMVTAGFISTFPQTTQGPEGLHVGATPLRGLWDRPQTRFYHDGRARSLRQALATPGHTILRPGEVGHNERDGVLDTHGGTSQLTRYELEDLMNFVLSL